MAITGIICEYNPLHSGHKKQLDQIRTADPDGGIVCLMSGNFVQRGKPAIFDKMTRAKAALECGADLVLELPVTAALSSAEGFAGEGVRILSSVCHRLCFGAETGNRQALMATAEILLSPDFANALKERLAQGLSFPAARQAALEGMGLAGDLLTRPNDILAVEYCKAILSQNTNLEPMVIKRSGSYHDTLPDPENPSATALRMLLEQGGSWQAYVPASLREIYRTATLHTMAAGERAVLGKLRTMEEAEFEALPYGSEGLWRKLMHAAHQADTLENILSATKSKRYTRSRLDRMVMCAFLGLTQQDMTAAAPYTRVLALNDRGRQILKQARLTGRFPNIGEKQPDAYQTIESRCGNLYGLFAREAPEPPGWEGIYRICYRE